MTEEELSNSKSIEQQLPLLITKLSIIRDNYNNSIEKRKQRIKEREKEIELHEQKYKPTPSIIAYNNNHSHRQFCSLSRNSNQFNSKDIASSNNNNDIKNIKHIKSTSSLTHYQNISIKPSSKIGLYMSKTTSKFNLKKSSSAFNLNDATCSIDKTNRNASSSVGFQRQHSFNISHSPKNQISHNNNNNKTKRVTVNCSVKTCKKQQHIVPTSKKYINQNVYHLPIDTLQKLKKLQLQKKEHSLKDYHESLISLGKVLLNKDNVKKLNKKFHRIRKDTNVKLGNTKQFLRWIEYKEEKIVDKINKIGQHATFLLNALQVKNPARFVRKIRFETVMK